MRGWLGYYGVADMKNEMQDWNEWLRRRICMYIWKRWKEMETDRKGNVHDRAWYT